MARSERQIPSVYFGRPGALVTMPWPRGDIDKAYERQAFDFASGSGQHSTSLMAEGSRSHKVVWNALHIDNYTLMSQYWLGANGTGPWAFIDPSTPNLLLPNQAGSTSLYNDTSGFATSTGATNMGTLSSNTAAAHIHRAGAPRSLRWQFTVGAASLPQLNILPPYRNWYGVPVVPGLTYNFSVWAKPDGTVDSSITMAAKIAWFDAAGGSLSDYSSGDIVMTGWTRIHTGMIPSPGPVAPAGAAYGRPMLIALGSTITTGASIYVDEFQMEQDTVANNWAPGAGTRPVEIVSFADTVPFETRMRRNIEMSLRELAA